MKNLTWVLIFLAIHDLLPAQSRVVSKPALNAIGKFTIGEDISRYGALIKMDTIRFDTSHFGVNYYYSGADANTIFEVSPTRITLNACSGQLIGISMSFPEISQVKAMAIQQLLSAQFGNHDYLSTYQESDATQKRLTWGWRSEGNSLVFNYDQVSSRVFASVHLKNDALTLKCMTRGDDLQKKH